MKLPNGFGSIYKLKGSRRNSYRVVLSQGYIHTEVGIKPKRTTLGYFPSKKEALEALTNYHENPYDINAETMTFEDVYTRWSEDHFKKLSNKSSIRTYKAAYNHSKPLHKMRFRDIRANHMEGVIEEAVVGVEPHFLPTTKPQNNLPAILHKYIKDCKLFYPNLC